MKKLFLFALAAIVLIGAPLTSQAADMYMGTGYTYQQFDATSVGEDQLDSGNLFVGAKVHQNLGVEVGASESFSEDVTGTETNLRTYSADLIGYLPLTDSVDLLGTTGVVYNELARTNSPDENVWGYTAGLGAQVKLLETVSLRGLAKFDSTDFDTVKAEDSIKYMASVAYHF